MTGDGWFQRYVVDTGFLQRYPLYAAILGLLEFESTTAVAIMAVCWRGDRFRLLANDEWFAANPAYRAGVLLHEVHHLVLGHLVQQRYFDVRRPDLMQVAMETAANEYIAESLPEPITWERLQQYGLRPHQSTMQRYRVLLRAARRLGDRLPPLLDEHRGGSHGVGIDEIVRGVQLPAAAAAALRVLLGRAQDLVQEVVPRERLPLPDPNELLPPADPRDGGLLGSRRIENVIAELTPPRRSPELDWRLELRAFATSGPQYDFTRPNRRQPERVFEIPGRSRRGGDTRVLVAIDTSSSMQQHHLDAIAIELQGMAQVADLTICECDEVVRRVYPFAGSLTHVHGRGGTDLRPPFAPELLRTHGRDGVVYFTDGEGPWPERPPPVRVLWVLTGPQPFLCPWGRRAKLVRNVIASDELDTPF